MQQWLKSRLNRVHPLGVDTPKSKGCPASLALPWGQTRSWAGALSASLLVLRLSGNLLRVLGCPEISGIKDQQEVANGTAVQQYIEVCKNYNY